MPVPELLQVGDVEEIEGISPRRQGSSFAAPIAEHALPDSDREQLAKSSEQSLSCCSGEIGRVARTINPELNLAAYALDL